MKIGQGEITNGLMGLLRKLKVLKCGMKVRIFNKAHYWREVRIRKT